jgi:DNA-binding transcriptional regulator YiaG
LTNPNAYAHMHDMSPIQHIRLNVFKVKQAEFAKLAGTNQSAVSRWEDDSKHFEPSREEMANIRAAASDLGIKWDDRWFFEVPAPEHQQGAA